MAAPCEGTVGREGQALPLSADALGAVLVHLDSYADLLSAGAACRQLRAAARAPALWHRLCRRRWGSGALNSHLFGGARDGGATPRRGALTADYRALFMGDNGWARPRLAVQHYAGVRWADEIVAINPCTEPSTGATTVAVSSCRELRLLELGPGPGGTLRVLRAANHSVHSEQGRELWSSVAALGTGTGGVAAGEGMMAVGGCYGRLAVYELPPWGCASPVHRAARPVAEMAFPQNSCLVSQLQPLPCQGRLAILHDPLALLRPTAQHSALSVVDLASWRLAEPAMRDVLDGYELAAAVPLGDAGVEFAAGSVKLSDDQASGWPCRRCCPAAPAALCFHKSAASSAALCMFDSRASQALVSRYSSHHRSLYPHLEPVRGHYLLTSHAGTPVACWDRRQMNGPVHEVAHIPRDLDPALSADGALPLEHPDWHERPATRALHLSATHDLLVGRADNGMCWLFDLSERLGWADGSHPGSWLRQHRASEAVWRTGAAAVLQAAGMEAGGGLGEEGGEAGADVDAEMMDAGLAEEDDGGHLDENDWEREPLPLGCMGAPFEVWCSPEDEAAPVHWLPPPAVWLAPDRLIGLAGLELEQKQALFPAHAQGSPYPSNALAAAALQGPGGRSGCG